MHQIACELRTMQSIMEINLVAFDAHITVGNEINNDTNLGIGSNSPSIQYQRNYVLTRQNN